MAATVFIVLVLIALACTIASFWGKPTLAVAVLLLCIIELLRALPPGSLHG